MLAQIEEAFAARTASEARMRRLVADARHDLLTLDPGRPVVLSGPARDGEIPPAPGAALVLGDEARLRQVTANLVGNVHAHTPATAPVRVGVGVVGNEAVLEVADTGPGLGPTDPGRVFERFFRADGSRARGGGAGAGLGLAIAWSLAAAHGGRVETCPTPGGGATFRLCLPALSVPEGSSAPRP